MSLQTGENLGKYQILGLLGEGGMATVYKAFDTRLEREVAIKVIRRDAFAPNEMEMLLKRFEREAKALAGLSHPNIVGVIDYGEHEGSPYIVMVYLSGGTLREQLGKPKEWRDAIHMLIPIAQALEYVHERNIINRDVKPSNILMTEKNQPMMTDFGLVKLFGDKEKEGTHLTSSGTGLGTPDYMAPEQWTGEATSQSDLYSLGVVLYEMITGYRPYTADTPAGVLLKQATESLPLPKSYIPDLPQNVESVLLKVLAKDPVNRYPNMTVFIKELQNLLEGKDVIAASIKPERLREQMTGKMDKVVAPPSKLKADSQKNKFPTLALFGGLGILGLLAIFGIYWFMNKNATVAETPTQAVAASEVAAIATETPATEPAIIAATLSPTETPAPVETSAPAEIKDNRNVTMVLIAGGEFTMGSDESGEVEAKPAHTVNVDSFYIDKYEVTNEQYDACVYAVECRQPLRLGSATRDIYYQNPVYANYPVIYLDWKMANAYCTWRGARLPTEAEWEKAARGTESLAYPWGNQKADCSYANISGCLGDTTPVDQYEIGQSIYGVFGMSGNVWEWTSSLLRPYPYDATDGREDPKTLSARVARGGSWHTSSNGGNARTDTRLKLDMGSNLSYVGVRCAITK